MPRGARKVGIEGSLAVARSYDPAVGPSATPTRVLAGYLAGITLGMTSITLLFLGMRAVMDVGGACADGGPYVSAQPCPDGVPLAMIGGMFGLFGSAGLIVWFGSRIGTGAAAIVALGWPLLFLGLGFNFLDYAFHPPDTAAMPVWARKPCRSPVATASVKKTRR